MDHPLCQKHYSTIEKEALALILILNVSGAPLLVYTDHNHLVSINSMRNSNQRLMRWSLFLQGYDLKICHIRCRDNSVLADALSRS